MTRKSVSSLANELAAGQTTSLALTEAALAHAADALGEGKRVFTKLTADQALASARASDLLRSAGVVRSPLEGIPISIKDCIDVTGQVTTAGAAALDDAAPAQHSAIVINRLIAAGAVIIGRTNMSEFAFSGLGLNPHYDTPRNPWGRDHGGRIPGGSSSGAAVSVTDDMAVVAIGTDTSGSVRIPAALCGLTGFKPTQARVPTAGVLPLSTSLDSIGPLGSSVQCCATVDAILANEPLKSATPLPIHNSRLLLAETAVLDDMDATVSAAFERALEQLSAAGARISHRALPEFNQDELYNSSILVAAEAWAWHRDLLRRAQEKYDPRVAPRIRVGEKINAADYLDALDARQSWQARVHAHLHDFDVLIMPTVRQLAPRIEDLAPPHDGAYFAANAAILRNTKLINFLDGCALTIPCHQPNEAPVGLMLAGPAHHDDKLLALGLSVEQVLRRGHT